MTKISIVIPVFNARARISEALESVRSQTYPRDQLEIIIIDDGSSDQTAGIARTFLQRHGMQGTVLVIDKDYGSSASLNRGWRAATGDWIQFLDSDDVLAPNKIEVQLRQISRLPDVICASWQRLELCGDRWQPMGPVTDPNLVEPVILKLVSPQAGLLGPALFRKKSLEAVAGFTDGVVYPDGEHLMLKLWGMGGKFVEAPSPLPLFFVRPTSEPRGSNANMARQHLQNVVIAEAMLRQQKFGIFTRQERKEIASLCDWSLSELYESDWAAFQQYWQWLREIEPNFIPRHSRKLKLASLALGYETAESLALARRWIMSGPARMVAWISNVFGRGRSYMPGGDAGSASGIEHDAPFALARGRSRFAGAVALVLVAGVGALAGMVAWGQLGGASAPDHHALYSRVAETSRPGGNPASVELPPPMPAAKVDQRSEIAPATTASVVVPEPGPSASPPAAEKPSLVRAPEQDRSPKSVAPVGPPEIRTGWVIAIDPKPASAPSASTDARSQLPRVEPDRSQEATAQIAPATGKAPLVIAPEAPLPSASRPAREGAPATKPDSAKADAGLAIASAEARTAIAPELPRKNTVPSPTPAPVQVQPAIEIAKADRRSPKSTPQVAGGEAKVALVVPPATPNTSAVSAPAEARTAPAPELPRKNTDPSPAPAPVQVKPAIEIAKADRRSPESTPQVATGEAKIALVSPPATPNTSAVSAPAEARTAPAPELPRKNTDPSPAPAPVQVQPPIEIAKADRRSPESTPQVAAGEAKIALVSPPATPNTSAVSAPVEARTAPAPELPRTSTEPSAAPAPVQVQPPIEIAKADRGSPKSTPQVAAGEAKIALVSPPATPNTSAVPPPAEARTAIAPDLPRKNTDPSPAPTPVQVQPPIEIAKADRGSPKSTPQVATGEAKISLVSPPETPNTSAVSVPVEARTAIAPELPRKNTDPSRAPAVLQVQPPIEIAKADRSSPGPAPQVAAGEAKIETPSTGAVSTPTEAPRVPTTGADHGGERAAPGVPGLSPREREGAERMVARGERELADGNVASARQFFQRAATAGLARGALLLAATYDPRELARSGVLGVQPSVAVARKWYERARELGAAEAEERLARLATPE